METFGEALRRLRGEISTRDLARRANCSKSYVSDLENNSMLRPSTQVVAALDTALKAEGELLNLHRSMLQKEEDPTNRREALSSIGCSLVGGGIVAYTQARVLKALDIVTLDDAGNQSTVIDCLAELISHYSESLSVFPRETYNDLIAVRAYAGSLLERTTTVQQYRSDLLVSTGKLSNLLAVASGNMGDHGAALVWCIDAERRSHESGHPEIAGWAALARAMMAYYQGRADLSAKLAMSGRRIVPIGTTAHAKLAAQEMRACAMLGDTAGMLRAKKRAAEAISALPPNSATTGFFSVALAEDPPYTATSLLLVGRFQEAVSTTQDLIKSTYPESSLTHDNQSSSYARTLLILGLAQAGLGNIDEAVAAGRAALSVTSLVWPTLVLARKLDAALMRKYRGATGVSEFHSLCEDAILRASHWSPVS